MTNLSHLFISYAVEDAELARWLARKLAARGHPVWFDQMKLLGGEPWPQTIDDAIKNRTFRMLGLISEHSLRKPKPTGERTLAQRIAEQRKIPDFLIPLKADASELFREGGAEEMRRVNYGCHRYWGDHAGSSRRSLGGVTQHAILVRRLESVGKSGMLCIGVHRFPGE